MESGAGRTALVASWSASGEKSGRNPRSIMARRAIAPSRSLAGVGVKFMAFTLSSEGPPRQEIVRISTLCGVGLTTQLSVGTRAGAGQALPWSKTHSPIKSEAVDAAAPGAGGAIAETREV